MKIFNLKVKFFCFLVFVFSFNLIAQTSVLVQVYYGGYGEECSWNITRNSDGAVVLSGSGGTSNSYSYNGNVSLYPGFYTFNAFDSYGDGWTDPNGWYQITPAYGIPTGQTFFSSGTSQATQFIVYFYSASDLGVTSWISPVSGPSLTNSQQVSISVKNFGVNTANSYTISYSINNGSSFVTQTINTPLSAGNTVNHTFTQTANFSAPGVYHCKAVAHLNGDVNYINDTLSIDINSIQTISTFPWNVPFNSWPLTGWSQQGGDHTWALYSSGNVSCVFCNFYYWPNGNAVMTTPPVNLTTPSCLKFSWSKGFNQNYLNDELQLSVSIDNGQTWTLIWDKSGADLNSNDGATSTSPGSFIQEVIDLSQFTYNTIYVRFNGISGYGYNLFVDNLIIETYPPSNLAAVEWLSPQNTSCGLTSGEPVTVKIQNLGAQTASNFYLGYSINGGQSYTTQYLTSANVASGSYYTHTFSQTANFSNLGTYNCRFFVHIANDSNGSNDTLSGITVKNLSVINNFPFTENFETGNTNYFNIQANENAGASIALDGTNKVLKLEGGSSSTAGWIGSYYGTNITTHENAWTNNVTHHAWGITCIVNASSLTTCELSVDLKQYYKYGSKYSWFRILVNNVQVADVNGISDFNPVTSYNDPYATRHFNLNAYAGTQFTLTLQGSNKLSSAAYPPGNVAFIDNIVIHQAPGNDIGISGLVSPVSGCTLSSAEHFTVSVQNNSSVSVSNIPVSYSINGGTSFVSETVTSVINSGASTNYTFNSTANLSATGTYNLIFTAYLQGDVNSVNDTLETTITHYAQSVITIYGLESSYCINSSPVTLSGNPSGGVFTGPGVTNGIFYPSSLYAGTYLISYSYTNTFGCNSQVSQSVVINGSPASFSGLSSQYCLNYPSSNLTGIPAGGVFSGQGISGSTFSPALAGTGTFIVTYNYTTGGCTTLSVQQVTVNPVPAPYLGQNLSSCTGSTLILTPGTGFNSYFWTTGATTASVNVTQSGNYTVVVTNTFGCSGSAQVNVVFNPVPVFDLGPDITICTGAYVTLNAGTGNSYIWSNGSNTSVIQVSQPGNYSVTVTNSFGCYATDQVMVYNYPVPFVNAGNDVTIYENQSIQLTATSGYNNYLWSDGSTNQSLTVYGNATGPGDHTYTVTITDANGCINSDQVVVTVLQTLVDQALILPSGWSIFSLYVIPGNLSVPALFTSIVNSVSIVKDAFGNVYWPEYNINTIGNLNTGRGYQIRMLSGVTLQVTGTIIIPEQTIISIPQGWSILGYLRTSPASVVTLLSSIVGVINIVKDENGQVYWPVFGFNNIGNMIPGKGYQINIISQSNYTYPPNGSVLQNMKTVSYNTPDHFILHKNTGHNMTLGIRHWAMGIGQGAWSEGQVYEIGVFSEEGLLVGSGVLNDSFTAIAVWGDDNMTTEKDGLLPGEKFILKIWDGIKELYVSEITWDSGNCYYQPDGVSVVRSITISEENNKEGFRLFQNNPNPFKSGTEIRFYLPNEGTIILSIYNIIGELKETKSCRFDYPGNHCVYIDGSKLCTGDYLYTVKFGDITKTKIFHVEN